MSDYNPSPETGDGVTTTFTVAFPYLSQDHVFASVDGVDTPFSWINAGLIEISPAPAFPVEILVYRNTPHDPLVTFVAGATLPERLNTAVTQARYIAEEADWSSSLADAAADRAEAAAAVAEEVTGLQAGTLVLKSGSTMTGPLILSGDPGAELQAATKQYVDALGATKSDIGHLHTFAEITAKPTTLGGYGITDAYTQSATDTLLANKADASSLSDYLPLAGGEMTNTLNVAVDGTQVVFRFTDRTVSGRVLSNAAYLGIVPADASGTTQFANRLAYNRTTGKWHAGDETIADTEVATKAYVDANAGGGSGALVAVKKAAVTTGNKLDTEDWFTFTHTMAAVGNFLVIHMMAAGTLSHDGPAADTRSFRVRLRVDGTLNDYMGQQYSGEDGDDVVANFVHVHVPGDTTEHTYTARTTDAVSAAGPVFSTAGNLPDPVIVVMEYEPT